MILFRFLAPLVLVLSLVAYLLVPWTDRLLLNWSEADLQMRSKLVFSSIEDGLSEALNVERASQLTKRFTQLAQDERLIGIGYCEDAGAPKYSNKDFPADITCPNLTSFSQPDFSKKTIKGGSVLVATFPVSNQDAGASSAKPGYLLIVHDMAYAERRSQNTQRYVLWFVIGVSLLAAMITVIVARLTLSAWTKTIRHYLQNGKPLKGISKKTIPLIMDIQRELRGLEKEYLRQRQEQVVWTEKSLQNLIKECFPSTQVLVASFREPVTHVREVDGRIAERRNVNGLVTALEPVVKACSGTWIAIGVGNPGDKSLDHVKIEEFGKHYFLKRLRQSQTDYEEFYHGICSGGIYPLCCSMGYIKPHFCEKDWHTYVKTNQLYADAIIHEARTESPIVLVQDYQLALVPRMVKQKLPNAIVVLYWHIPWPNSEIFSILPWGKEFLDGILASDIVGLQTPYMCNNFFDVVRANLEARIDTEQNAVERFGHSCLVRSYPVSIEWPLERLAHIESTEQCHQKIRSELRIPLQNKVFLGVERMDFVKGIPERLLAFQTLLKEHPQMRGKVNLIQIAALSPRKELGVYAATANEVQRICSEINEEFGTPEWKPVFLSLDNHTTEDVYRLYRAADVCVVSSLQDGMNLVAKEFIAARDDEKGVVIISRFAGAAKELPNCISVNPHDQISFVKALVAALNIPESIQIEQMREMRQHLQHNNIYAWAGKMLADASILHKKQQLNAIVSQFDG